MMKIKAKKIATLKSPIIDLMSAEICLRREGIVFIALSGLRILSVRISFKFIALLSMYSNKNSTKDDITIMKSSWFHEDLKYAFLPHMHPYAISFIAASSPNISPKAYSMSDIVRFHLV